MEIGTADRHGLSLEPSPAGPGDLGALQLALPGGGEPGGLHLNLPGAGHEHEIELEAGG